MRFLAVFLLTFLPLVAGLWYLARDRPPLDGLPDEPTAAPEAPVLTGEDLADEYGATPLRGRLLRARKLVAEVVRDGYVRYYVTLEKLARHEGAPRLDTFVCAVFDRPEQGRPNLRLTIEAPHIEGDLAPLLHGTEGASKVANLSGGVIVRDSSGRELFSCPSLLVDFGRERLDSPHPVALRFPDRGVTVSGRGLAADLQLRSLSVLGDVTVAVPKATLSCRGRATVQDMEGGDELFVTLSGRARIDHPLGTADAARIEARVVRIGAAHELRHALLDGDAVLSGGGLKRVSAPWILIEGERRIVMRGPVVAERRGQVEALGWGERTLDISAGAAELLLADGELQQARFPEGLRVTDRDGAGFLFADALVFDRGAGLIGAWGNVRAKTPDATVASDRLRVETEGRRRFTVLFEGTKRIEHAATGRLAPLGEWRSGTLVVTSHGPLWARQRGDRVLFHGRDSARVFAGDSALLCDDLFVALLSGTVRQVTATGTVDLSHAGRQAKLHGDSLDYRDGRARLQGRPAALFLPGRRTLRAHVLVRHDDESFVADGSVRIETPLQSLAARSGKGPAGRARPKQAGTGGKKPKGRWVLTCGHAEGTLPDAFVARGSLVAVGPEGERFTGGSLEYDGRTGRAVLLGEPAVLSSPKGLWLQAPGFDLTLVRDKLERAVARGPSLVEVWPSEGRIRLWRIRLRGPAVLVKEQLTAADGADLEAFDGRGRILVKGGANRVEVALKRLGKTLKPVRVRGSRGVTVTTRKGRALATVVAEALCYEVDKGEVDVTGHAKVEAEGWPRDILFERVVFVLTADGVDLKRASQVRVVDRKR